ncbi:TIGR02301 family protein [Polymorphum gilvum]|uniref:TIGR02301 family protein n=1 Tax=Polymorphum gilvum (strain LMG 25793 / CGMCC 1.9160 / SL003B-26A1) TaxID=991905 RepID=F2IZ22_POLGS|nr:TIGR02301 family protein [Polymorphum gilvum]ADZ71745.1 hypothetical protein SL003B_3323 [Polymorphum gilvum SL003B-26A1]
MRNIRRMRRHRLLPDPLPPRRRALRVAATLCLCALLGGAAAAQQAADEPPYEPQLMRLSEILGALHYLRPLCAAQDSPSWRDRMQDLLDAEALDEARRRRFVERFNQGYRGFASVYRTCTPSARIAMNRYIGEGADISRDVTSRYSR